jgi:hypothetical protein
MTRAAIKTGLPIAQFAEVLGLSKWLVSQWKNPIPATMQGCDAIYQWMWQKNAISRYDLAQAISNAEQKIADYLGYYPAPRQIENEQHPYPQVLGKDVWGFRPTPTINTNYQRVAGIGTLTRTLIADAPVTLTDTDGDGVVDTFTASTTTTLIDARFVEAYIRVADRIGEGDEATWQIQPVRVTLAGTTLTVTGDPVLLLKPVLQEGVAVAAQDPKVLTNYLTSISIVNVLHDGLKQGYVQYAAGRSCCETNDCSVENLTVCYAGHEWQRGIVEPRLLENATNAFCRQWLPDMTYINYTSGLPYTVDGKMQNPFAAAVAKLACTYLPLQTCGCNAGDQVIAWWRQDLTQDTTGGQFPGLTYRGRFPSAIDEACPFGFTRGGMEAWRAIREHSQKY